MSRKGKRKVVLVGIICCLFLVGGMVANHQTHTEFTIASPMISGQEKPTLGTKIKQTIRKFLDLQDNERNADDSEEDVANDDRLLANAIHTQGGGAYFEELLAIGTVILNHLEGEKVGKSIPEVVSQAMI